MHHFLTRLLCGLSIVLCITSCGGGGGGGGGGSRDGGGGGGGSSSASVTGVAATGAPIIGGTVTIKDANGITKTANINNDGSFTLDVTGLSAPFLFEATGVVGGSQIVLHSVSESAPGAGSSIVTNITPLTESIVANIAGADPSDFFDSPVNGKVSAGAIQVAQNALKNALSNLIAAAGLSSNIDLLKTPFAADKTGIDALLESIQVTVTVQGNTPVIQLVNKYNPAQVVTLTGTGTPTQSGTITQSNLPDLSKIDELATQFTAAIASTAAMNSLLPGVFDDGYLNSGKDKAEAVSDAKVQSKLIGATFSKPVIDTCNSTGDLCRVKLMLTYQNGDVEAPPQTLKKQENGSWKLYGNQYRHEFSITPYAQRSVRIPLFGYQPVDTGLQIYISRMNVGSAIVYFEKNDGTSEVFMKLKKRTDVCPYQDWLIFDHPSWSPSTCPNFLPMTDQNIDALTALGGAIPRFTIILYNNTDYTDPIGIEGEGMYLNQPLTVLPLKSTQLEPVTAPFAQLTDLGISNFTGLGASGPLTLIWQNFNPLVPVHSVDVKLVTNDFTRLLGGRPLVGTDRATFIGMDQQGTVNESVYRSAYLTAKDGMGRKFVTKFYTCGSQLNELSCY